MTLTVLIVDDASFVRDTIKRMLRQFLVNIELLESADGRRALTLLRHNKVDIVLSDWEMPEMSGAELLHWVRTEYSNPDLPFIMISSRGDRNHIVKAIEAGVSDYLSKPFTPEELQRKVSKQLHKIGYKDTRRASQRDTGFGSIDVLTGGNTEASTMSRAASQDGSPAMTPQAKEPKKSGSFEGKAQLRFANASCQCIVRELSLQSLSGFMVRTEQLPTVFDQAVVDLENKQGEPLARLNAYVHSIQAVENSPDTRKLKIVVQFVDNDPDKFEIISKAITQ